MDARHCTSREGTLLPMSSESNTLINFAKQWGRDKWSSEDSEHLKDRFWADLACHGYTIGGKVGADLFTHLYDAVLIGQQEVARERGIAKEMRERPTWQFPYLRKELYAQVIMLKRMSRTRAKALMAAMAVLGR